MNVKFGERYKSGNSIVEVYDISGGSIWCKSFPYYITKIMLCSAGIIYYSGVRAITFSKDNKYLPGQDKE